VQLSFILEKMKKQNFYRYFRGFAGPAWLSKNTSQAPMLEALAAAAIYATIWDKASTFINPMCVRNCCYRSGMIATNRGRIVQDKLCFMHLQEYDEMYISKKKIY